jgi:pentatricopeptide repeat protein
MIQLYVEKGDIDKATTIYQRMLSKFSEKVISEYKEYIVILENALKKQRDSFKSFSGYAKNSSKEIKEEPSAIGKPAKSRWLPFILGGFLTILGAGTLYFIFRNRNKFNI